MSSYKTDVIAALFLAKWNPISKSLTSSMVSLLDVQNEIHNYNAKHGTAHSSKNPANFFKDMTRKAKSFNSIWPKAVFSLGYTAIQSTGAGQCFEFVALSPGQITPYPFPVPAPPKKVSQPIPSIVLPLKSRLLGRRDEAWLTQVAVKLRVVETHFASYSPRKVIHMDHLQMNVKLQKTEIDSLYLATERDNKGVESQFVVTVEAKGKSEDITLSQIAAQVKAAALFKKLPLTHVVAVAMKVCGPSEIQLLEWEGVTPAAAAALKPAGLKLVKNNRYKLRPDVKGID